MSEVLELKTSPHSIAMGFALGTLIAIFPTFGLGIAIGLGLIFIFKNISKISMLISFAVWNPLILALMYPLNYKMGEYFLSDAPIKEYGSEILNQLYAYSGKFVIGSIINGIIISVISYIVVLLLAYRYQGKRSKGLKEEIEKIEETLEVK